MVKFVCLQWKCSLDNKRKKKKTFQINIERSVNKTTNKIKKIISLTRLNKEMYSHQRSFSTNQISSMYNYNQSNARYPNLQRSNSVIVSKRGFRPSDRFDPAKKEFLLQLSRKIWQRVRIPIANYISIKILFY